jgi:hypothetical protein
MITITQIFFLALIQNISFTMVSRSRNRDNMYYHAICAVFSNGLWFATMHTLVKAELTWILAIPYIIGTVIGSLFGAKISMKIELLLGAKT